VIVVVGVAGWVIVLIAFVVLSAAVRGASPRARTKPSARKVKNENSDEQLGPGKIEST
jgi:hypothetical protein